MKEVLNGTNRAADDRLAKAVNDAHLPDNCPTCRQYKASIAKEHKRGNSPSIGTRMASGFALGAAMCAMPPKESPPLAILGPGGDFTREIKP